LCCGQLDFSRLCLESVLRNTRQPYELILIDNASTDGTTDYLRSLASRAGPVRVKVVINAVNRGFPAGCNQGLAEATGDYVLFLNNDIIVSAGWIDPLVAIAARYADGKSLVGPVTNNASPPHPVPVTYRTLDEIELFAQRWATEHERQISIVPRLSAFCLLGKRAFISSLGGFDEGYGIGLFDDDDLCLRAKNAGAELVLARQVFIHHFGSRTFHALAVDGPRQLTENFRRFAAKWGPGVAAGYHLPNYPASDTQPVRPFEQRRPQGVAVALPPTRQPNESQRVSLCMIVKNEESRLAHCLGSVADFVNEIVIVDTGSTDRTKEIAVQFGAKVADIPWKDSFAAARNASIDRASGEWIFWMDADDYLDVQNREKLRSLFRSLTNSTDAYMMRIVSEEASGAAGKMVDHVRLFRNHPRIRWEYRVHEQILRAVTEAGGREQWTDIVIRHTGYRDRVACHLKHERNLRLLHLEAKDRPDDPFTLFNLGWTYQVVARYTEAVAHLERGISMVRPGVSFARKMYAVLVNAYRRLGRPGDALAWSHRGLVKYPDDSELLYQNAMLSYEAGDLVTPEKQLRRLLEPRPPSHFAIGVDEGLTGYLARYNLGVVARDLGRLSEAEQFWRAAVAERPDYAAAWVGLAELSATSERWGELDAMILKLESDPVRRFEAFLVRARAAIGRDAAAALRALDQAAAIQPDSIWVPLLRSHLYLQGGDLTSAEQALREVLSFDPGHHQARANLDRIQSLRIAANHGPPSTQVYGA
jgi:glycosyltransferase involved in cell wall biosynthesis